MKSNILDDLKAVPLLAGLSEPLLEQIATFSRIRVVRAGETIFCQGEPSPYCFVIIRGQVSIQRVSVDRRHPAKLLSLLGAGDFFGESALFDDCARVVMASATQEGQLIAISGTRWREWIRKDAAASVPLLMGLLQNMMARLQQASADLAAHPGN